MFIHYLARLGQRLEVSVCDKMMSVVSLSICHTLSTMFSPNQRDQISSNLPGVILGRSPFKVVRKIFFLCTIIVSMATKEGKL